MLLTKSCHAKDHIARRKTLKLATLEHYRKTEIEQISDTDEGVTFFDIDICSPVNVDKKWFNTLFQGIMRVGGDRYEAVPIPGQCETQISNWSVDDRHPAYVVIERANISIKRQAVNSLIFCMSQSRTPGDCIGIFPDYDDEWSIRANDIHRFLDQIANAIKRRMCDNSKASIIAPEINPVEVDVYFAHMSVLYADRNIIITKDHKTDINNLVKHMTNAAFIKPISFEKEKEYRFSFILTHKGQTISTLSDTVIINIDDEFLKLIV